MDMKSLEALGITAEQLIDRIVDKCVAELMTDVSFDEDGDEWRGKSSLARKLDARIQRQIDMAVGTMADKYVLPNVSAYIEGLTLTATNQWGEAKGQKLTFIEYLTQRADAYMREDVDFQGREKKACDSYSWKASGTRVAYMVNQHLHYSIETAMKQALATANASIVGGLEQAMKTSLSNVLAGLKVEVKTAR
jgi:hypothetical protein